MTIKLLLKDLLRHKNRSKVFILHIFLKIFLIGEFEMTAAKLRRWGAEVAETSEVEQRQSQWRI